MCESGEDFTEERRIEPDPGYWFWFEVLPVLCGLLAIGGYIALAIYLFRQG